MQDIGISGKNVSAAMGVAQAGPERWPRCLPHGPAVHVDWPGRDAGGRGRLLVSPVRRLRPLRSTGHDPHCPGAPRPGLRLLYLVGWMFVNDVAPKAISSSAQSLIYWATNALGVFLGTQLAGFTMDKFSAGGKFQWSKVFAVPLLITLVGAACCSRPFTTQSRRRADARGGETCEPEAPGAKRGEVSSAAFRNRND